ncbi:thiol:disulfide interchange protein DsbA/DsbL, partial [Kaarinaea lacus]
MKNWIIAICGLALLPGLALAAPTYKEKIHYERVLPAQPTTTGDKVEVVEMFWYGCPHCNNLEPYVNRWLKKKPAQAEFVRMPAIFRPEWELHARAYYTAEILGVLEKTHAAMFEAIHQQKRRLNTDAEIQKLFAEHGVSAEDFNRVFRSFAVEAKIRRAKDMSERYGIRGVPALIVNGKYRTGARLAGGNANIFRVVDYLVAQESQGK